MSSGLSIENFLEQWEVPSITGYTFDAADRVLCKALQNFFCGQDVQRYRRDLFTYLQKGGIPLQYSAAKDFVTMMKKLKGKKRMHRREVLKSAGIGSRTTSTTVASYYLKRLVVPYPATNTWVAETSTTFTDWAHYMENYTLADGRHKHYPVGMDRLQLVVNTIDNVVVYDMDTQEIVLVVLRSFGGSQLAGWVDNIAAKATEVGTSGRLDDPGKMVLQGYTAGNLSKPVF
ncbi:hypothetical protein BDZ91DRAFT_850656 [Kalaharituber pfeilii]|nr:hypothetical protein BDZ91DRAFT_850656 [Kalaharituber pfeilii]